MNIDNSDYSNETVEKQDNSTNNVKVMSKTGNPIAILLISVIFSSIGFKRKD